MRIATLLTTAIKLSAVALTFVGCRYQRQTVEHRESQVDGQTEIYTSTRTSSAGIFWHARKKEKP